jgi:multidrug efflux pump subunit AcrA (membrane-fusion protein)
MPPPQVTVSRPHERDVTDYTEFTARTTAVDSVEVRAHVWGYLEKVNFKEGDLVKKGDILFELDPRPYQALLNQAKAKVRQDEAQLRYDDADYQRNLELVRTGAVSRQDVEKSLSSKEVDIANIAADKAVVVQRQLDLDYTKVTAPVSGRVSRYVVTVGNLIQSGDQGGGTLLTTIVSMDPMYAYFDVDEYTARASPTRPAPAATPCSWGLPTRRATLTREPSTLWTTRSTRRPVPSGCGVCSPTRRNTCSPAISLECGRPLAGPTRRCWLPSVPSTPTRARRSSTWSTRRTRSSLAPFASEHSMTACARSRTA